jgi:hypothetical protein
MNVQLIPIKIQERLNKLASSDYDNIHCWQFILAFNKAQIEWVRRQLHGTNQHTEGDEVSRQRVDDLSILIKTKTRMSLINKGIYSDTGELPADYMAYKRIDISVSKDNCKDIAVNSRLVEVANVNEYLTDWTLQPSFEWRETFHTMAGKKFQIYHNKEFNVSRVDLLYYRLPREVSLAGCVTIDGKDNGDVNPEFKDDIVELLIDDAASILAGDMESYNASQITNSRAEKNN